MYSKHITFYSQQNLNICLIGDVHECVDELDLLLKQIPNDYLIYLIGDWVDKNNNTAALIDYLYEYNLTANRFLLLGNHEDFVYRNLNNPNYNIEKDTGAIHFPSLKFLLANKEYADKFNFLYESAYNFIEVLDSENKPLLYSSHSLCKKEHLGKTDSKSITAMKKIRFSWNKPILDQLDWFYEEADINEPIHVFGHINVGKDNFTYLNKISIDQGCVEGGYLTACLFNTSDVKNMKFIHQPNLKIAKHVRSFPLSEYN